MFIKLGLLANLHLRHPIFFPRVLPLYPISTQTPFSGATDSLYPSGFSPTYSIPIVSGTSTIRPPIVPPRSAPLVVPAASTFTTFIISQPLYLGQSTRLNLLPLITIITLQKWPLKLVASLTSALSMIHQWRMWNLIWCGSKKGYLGRLKVWNKHYEICKA